MLVVFHKTKVRTSTKQLEFRCLLPRHEFYLGFFITILVFFIMVLLMQLASFSLQVYYFGSFEYLMISNYLSALKNYPSKLIAKPQWPTFDIVCLMLKLFLLLRYLLKQTLLLYFLLCIFILYRFFTSYSIIHVQVFYLNSHHKRKLKEEFGQYFIYIYFVALVHHFHHFNLVQIFSV